MNIAIQAAGKTDVGLIRQNNEDNFGYDTRYGIFVVCDGMGGQAAGELASKIAVDTMLRYFRQDTASADSHILGRGFEEVSEGANALADAVQMANKAIQEHASHNPAQAGMGSTVVVVHVQNEVFSIAHVGDSRIYLIRDGIIQQLTSDHSFVMEQVRRGLISIEEAENSEMQNVIVRALGSEESVEPDLADHAMQPGDILLLCTDGLSRYVSDDRMLEIITQAENLETGCEQLIDAAKQCNSDDNITCLLLRAVEQSWGSRLLERLIAGKGVSQQS